MRTVRLLSLLALVLPIAACAGDPVKPHYSEASVQPISARALGDGQLSLTYRVPLESMFFSPGVDYQTEAGTLRVVIGRCRIRTDCTVMAERVGPLTADGMLEVRLPYRGEKILVAHADKEQLLSLQ